MGRKSYEYLNKLKKKYQVDIIWSWSRYNSYKTDPYGYLLKYILHEKETRTNIYSVSGGNCHDIIESFYLKKIKYKDMLPLYEEKLFEMNLAKLKYNRKDEKANKKIATKYENNVRLFFQQHIILPYKLITEQFVTIKVGDNIFQGYIDAVYKDKDGFFRVTDWKTSTIYTGRKVLKERGQLVLYAESLIQRGIPLEKIKCQWNFLKYCTITYTLKGKDKETKQHKTKNTNSLRTEWVSKIANNLKMWLKESKKYNELEIEELVNEAMDNNNLDNIPKEIQDKYIMNDCYVEIPLNKEVIDELKQDIIDTIDEINKNKKEYYKLKKLAFKEGNKDIKQKYINESEKLWWTEIDEANEFYFNCLCGYGKDIHKPYKEHLDDLNMFINKDKNNSIENKENMDDIDDMKWLDDLD